MAGTIAKVAIAASQRSSRGSGSESILTGPSGAHDANASFLRSAALEFSGSDVVARSVALASEPPGPVTGRQRLVAMTGGFGMLAAIVAQGHHLVVLYEQFCR